MENVQFNFVQQTQKSELVLVDHCRPWQTSRPMQVAFSHLKVLPTIALCSLASFCCASSASCRAVSGSCCLRSGHVLLVMLPDPTHAATLTSASRYILACITMELQSATLHSGMPVNHLSLVSPCNCREGTCINTAGPDACSWLLPLTSRHC
eukprot:GHUV01045959.1.p1 GENE.GHUV01045959.1~~GHUV01045959.1.p1  ORF type:complete len:152 (+),score=13.83 GHUV01045959.1:61-516(+)